MKRCGQVATKASPWRFPRRWKSFPVSFLPSPFIAPVPPGPGNDVRNMKFWLLVEKTVMSENKGLNFFLSFVQQ